MYMVGHYDLCHTGYLATTIHIHIENRPGTENGEIQSRMG